MGVCPPKMKGDAGKWEQKEQHIPKRGSMKSRPTGREYLTELGGWEGLEGILQSRQRRLGSGVGSQPQDLTSVLSVTGSLQ